MADKKPEKKKKIYHYADNIEVSGDSVNRKGTSCPKCGPGFCMASHKDRHTCGKCGYMEKK